MTHPPFQSLKSFRLDQGVSVGQGDCVFAAPATMGAAGAPASQSQRWLVATVEPVEKTEHGWAVAGQALEALRHGFAALYDAPLTDALARGFASANACVRTANRGASGSRAGGPVLVGASAVVVDGPHLLFAHVPPSQIVFTQDRLVYTIPSLHSWEPHFAGTDHDGQPLGALDQADVRYFQTAHAERDTVVLCSTSLGRAISALPSLVGRLSPPHDPSGRPLSSLPVNPAEHPITMLDMGPIRPAGPDPTLAWSVWLDEVAAERNVPACHAVIATIGDIASRSGQPAGRRTRRRESGPDAPPRPEPGPAAPSLRFAPATPAPPPDAHLARIGRPQLMNVAVDPIASMNTPRMARLPGAHGVRRFSESDQLSADGWRVRLPRWTPTWRVSSPRWASVLLVALLLAMLGGGIGHLRSTRIANAFAASLASVDAGLDVADADDDASRLGRLRGDLIAMTERFGPRSEIEVRFLRLVAVEDRLLGRLRLGAPTQIGRFPGAATPTVRPLRLLHLGTEVFIVADALYQLDGAGPRLIRVFGPGDSAEGLTSGPLLDGISTPAGIAVTDGSTIFNRDIRGRWTAEEIDATVTTAPETVRSLAVYGGQVVAIDGPSGRLISLPLTGTDAGGVPALPESVLGGEVGAIDLATEDQLYILGLDGTVTAVDARGEARTIAVETRPALTGPRAMDTDDGDVWLLDAGGGQGRLTLLDPDTGETTAWEMPMVSVDAPSPLAVATEFTVDRAAGRIVFLVGDAIWSTPLPEP